MADEASHGAKQSGGYSSVEWDTIARELTSPPRRFHDDFLQALQPSFMEFAAKNSMMLADQLTHFLSREFPSSPLTGHATYARHVLEKIHRMRMEAPVSTSNIDQDSFLKHPSTISNLYISFMELKTALQMPTMISHRLATLDPNALCPAVVFPIVSAASSHRPRSLTLPSLSIHSVPTGSTTNHPREFRANVCKRSRKWLGGPPRPRILVVKRDVVELFKKGDKKKASTSVLVASIDTITKSTTFELTVLSKDSTTLVLTCDTPDTLCLCISEIATTCLVHALDTGQPASVVQKFVASGARVTGVQGHLTRFIAPCSSSSMSTIDLIGMAYVADERSHVRGVDGSHVSVLLSAGASCRPLLRWPFAAMFFLRKSPLSRNILDFFTQHQLPLDAVGDDAAAWSLLQYLCLMRNVSSVERFVMEVTQKADGNTLLLRCLQHVNGANDSVLHIVFKPHNHQHCDIGERHSTINPITSSTTSTGQIQGRMKDEDAEWIGCMLLQAAVTATASVKSTPSPTIDVFPRGGIGVVLTMEQPWVNHCDGHGDTLLHASIKASMWKCVELLLALHASPTIPDLEGNTALHLALKMDAPYPLVCHLIRSSVSRTKQHLVDQISPSKDGNRAIYPFATTYGGFERLDQHGDTALTLALKLRNEQIVVRLLESGAQSNYHQPSLVESKSSMADSPLHIAIKTGLPTAAQALVLHGAAWNVKDAHGSTPLPLAIRHGMYALAYDLLQACANERAAGIDASLLVDECSGESLVGLCFKAGQLEVAVLVLDLCGPLALHTLHTKTHESPLHYAMKLRMWMNDSNSRLRSTMHHTTPSSTSSMTDRSSPAQPLKPAHGPRRSRFKSKSDSDIGALLVGDWSAMTTQHDHHNGFIVRVLEGMVLGLLKQMDPMQCLAIPAKPDSTSASHNTYHVVFREHRSIVDHHPDWFTPLHAAASGGRHTNHILRWMLHQLEIKTREEHNIVAFLSDLVVGPLRETVLHAAIASSSLENVVDVLHFVTSNNFDEDSVMHLLNASRTDHATALHLIAADAGNSPSPDLELVTRLLQLNVDKESWNAAGLTPLQVAIQQGASSSWIERMLDEGCDLNGRAEDGRVPVMVALMANNHEAFHTLVRAGANVKAVLPNTRVGLVDLANQTLQQPLHLTIVETLAMLSRRAQHKGMQPAVPLSECKELRTATPRPSFDKRPSMSLPDSARMSFHHSASLPPDDARNPTAMDENCNSTAMTPSTALGTEKKTQDPRWLLHRLKDEERTTLRLVALEAKQQAREWLTKRIGKQKILSDSLLLRQQYLAEHGHELDATSAHIQAEKLFIERHVADMVSEAKLEIEREKQTLLYEATRVPLKEPTRTTQPSEVVSKHMRNTSATSTFLLESFIGPHLDPDDDDGMVEVDEGYLVPIDYVRNTLC
ncbi:hypothetical protein H310_13406 [Aphanomyces invadans]|uniref:Uncharacterized protein n=1 Tax=Aphanomyces invadans TaxID=157072 RepID=A0A024TDL5_9STRA|nr:hypothetical protein H310_13406 [Aphanomyces invadans]ETV92153.1 hypothetical protein H310_13406 [Aphanomyces invadans]|eukprot:XP_008879117.1 hypothetical protein H310_13406 [Aphanomyces invadans]